MKDLVKILSVFFLFSGFSCQAEIIIQESQTPSKKPGTTESIRVKGGETQPAEGPAYYSPYPEQPYTLLPNPNYPYNVPYEERTTESEWRKIQGTKGSESRWQEIQQRKNQDSQWKQLQQKSTDTSRWEALQENKP